MFDMMIGTSPVEVIGANTTAILVALGLVVLVLVLFFAGRKKGGAIAEEAESKTPASPIDAPAGRARVPSSKEVFEPLPTAKPEAKKAEAKKVEAEPAKADKVEEGEPGGPGGPGGKDEPWELLEDDETEAAGPARKPAVAERVETKTSEKAEAKAPPRVAPEPAKADKPAKPDKADKVEKAPEAPEAQSGATAAAPDPVAEAARIEAEKARKKAEEERHAELARQAEARDKALKAEAERKKAEAKALAEEQARERAEQKKKEAAARAEEEKKRKAEEEKKKAEQDKKKAEQDKKKAPRKDEVVHKLEIPPKAAPTPERLAERPDEEPAKTLKDGLGRTRKEGFIAKLGSLFAGKQLDQDLVDEVEEALFTADIGVRTADRLLQAVKDALSKKELKDANKVWEVLRAEAQKILEGAVGKPETQPKEGEPKVTMVLGVNGTGKTTSIGKLAHKLVNEGRQVTLVAGDTFRAAAAEQLEHWARRVNAVCIRGKEGADPASVVFDGVKQAVDNKAEFVLVDTAGRLHNNVNLMEELKKVRRVMGRAIESAPHEVLMVLDATTGQNGITQAKLFKEATDVTGIILTKLDGTAKGGVVLGVCDELKIPIKWIGVGERVSDLRPFDPKEFVDELFAPPV